jgi:hypothetical protein
MSNSSLNATKHGCCAVDARLLPGESEKEYRNLDRIWTEAYQPKNDHQRHLVTELVNADWLLQRTTRNYLDIEAKLNAKSTNPLDWTEEEQRTLGRFQRYRTAHANAVARCRKALDDERRNRQSELLFTERLKAARRKNEIPPSTPRTEPTWKEKMQEMRQQAIDLGYTPPDLAFQK